MSARSKPEGFDWLVDVGAAKREQFPTLAKVMPERPGTVADRSRREFYVADNRARTARSIMPADVAAVQERDADEFIAMMRQRERERFLTSVDVRRYERKTA